MNAPDSSTARKRASSSGISGSYCDWTSTSGIVTARHCSCPHPSEGEIRRAEHDTCHDRIFRVFEAVIEVLVARAERVADACDHERPDGGADRGVERVRREPHLEDARRDRDERAHERRHAPDEDAEVPPAPEPPLGTVEPFRRHVQQPTMALEQGTAAAQADPPADERA